eukprot:jgi/Mesvir1/15278/Mv06496-RA.1
MRSLSGQGEGKFCLRLAPIVVLLLFLHASALWKPNYVAAAAEDAHNGDKPKPGITVHPILSKLHDALVGSPAEPKASKNAKSGSSKDSSSSNLDFLLQAAGRSVPGPGPSYTVDAEKTDLQESGGLVVPASAGKPESRGVGTKEEAQSEDPSKQSHVQLRVTGVLKPDGDADATTQQLTESCKAVDVAIDGRGIYAWVPASTVPCLGTIEGALSWSPSLHLQNSAGQGGIVSQGDAAIRADIARAMYGVTGRGVKVGILADSFDMYGMKTYLQEAGELPLDLEILKEGWWVYPNPCDFLPSCASDEGRRMAEIIHDVAPDASIAFHTSAVSQLDAANGIRHLAAAGCQVIVAAFYYMDEPAFFDGLIATAVNQVTSRGVVYVASAGNLANNSYEAPFHDDGNGFHDFDPDTNSTDTVLSYNFNYGIIILQWDQPWSSQGPWASGQAVDWAQTGAQTVVRLCLTSSEDRRLKCDLYYFFPSTLGADPIQIIQFGGYNMLSVFYDKSQPGPKNFKLVFLPDFERNLPQPVQASWPAGGSTIWGHRGAEPAISVGAAEYSYTPVFDGSLASAVLQPFSSRGGTRIMFDEQGNHLGPEGVMRQNPTVVGPDGVDVSDWQSFHGTSAAAPHVAGLVALLLSGLQSVGQRLSPADTRQALQSSAHTMGVSGYDVDSGAGFVDAVGLMEPYRQVLRGLAMQSLLSFKQGLDSSTTAGVLDDWVEGGDPCDDGWTGVACIDGLVTELSLLGRDLAGTLSPALVDLRVLRVLDLQGNALSGTLPLELARLENAQSMRFGGNALSGTLPVELARLENAQSIDLWGNQLSGSIPFAFDRLRQLVTLDLHDNAGLTGCIPFGVYSATEVLGTGLNSACGDTFDTAIVVPTLPFTYLGDSSIFAHDVSAQDCDNDTTVLGPDVVFQLRAERDAVWRISLCGSSYDTLFLLTRPSNDLGDPNVVLGCEDDSSLCDGSQQSGREVFVTANETYYVIVTGKAEGDAGSFALDIKEVTPSPDIVSAERQALQDFKAGLLPMMDPRPAAPLASWDGANACSFEGVNCLQGRVAHLSLPDLGLAGTLWGPTQQPLMRLKGLQSVDLSLNPGLRGCTLGLLRSIITFTSEENNLGLCGDTAQQAVTIPSLPFEYVDDMTAGFSRDSPVRPDCGYNESPDVIFEYTPNTTGMVFFSACMVPFPYYYYNAISIFPANRTGSSLFCTYSSVYECPRNASMALFAGVKYYIVVSKVNWWAYWGVFNLTVSAGSPIDLTSGEKEHSTLLDIKAALQDGPTILTDWKQDDIRYCFWQGVRCNSNLEVEALSFRGQGMRGTVPAAIGNLTALLRLDLSSNDFEGTIPKELAGPPINLEKGRRVSLNFTNNPRLTGCVPDEIAFKLYNPCERWCYDYPSGVYYCCSYVFTSIYLDRTNVGTPFYKGLTRVTCRAVDIDNNVANCTLNVTVTTRQPYLGTAVIYVADLTPETFTPVVLSLLSVELAAANSLNVNNFFDVKVEEVLAPRPTRSLLAAPGSRIFIVFTAGSLRGVQDVVDWFSSANVTMGQILARVLGVPVSTPTVPARVNGGACCLPPTPAVNDLECLVDLDITNSALCQALGRRMQPNATRDAIWLGPDAQCSECAALKGTWMDQIAVLHGGDNIVVSTGAPAGFPGLHGSVSINGRTDMSVGSSASVVVAKGLTVRRKKTRTWVTVEGILDLEVEVVRASTWEAGKGPGRDFLNFRVRGLNATEDVHGVLGQTFRPAALGAAKSASKGMVEGADPEYMTSDLLAADCSFSRFSPTEGPLSD